MQQQKKPIILGIGAFVIITIGDLIFFLFKKIEANMFYFIFGMGVVIGVLPFILQIIFQTGKEEESNEMFLEFSRDLVENVKSGTPISRGIINLRTKYYGKLTPQIQKLANQISLGIPVSHALESFARDVNTSIVKRAISMIREAERAGGEIESILESVSKSVSEIEKLIKERKAAIYSLVMEGYIIFFVFILIMLIMQFKILPMTSEISGGDLRGGVSGLGFGGGGGGYTTEQLTRPMLFILLAQGLFAGLMIGKLSEGNVKAGIKHSFLMVASSLLIYLGAKALFG